MDYGDFPAFEARGAETGLVPEPLQSYLKQIEGYLITSHPCVLYPYPDDLYGDVLKLFNAESVSGDSVLMTYYGNSADLMSEIDEKPRFTGTWPINALLERLADGYAGSVEFVNDFRVAVAVGIDERTALIVAMKQDEIPGICEHCLKDADAMALNPQYKYNCGHGEKDTYYTEHWLALLDRTDLKLVNWDTGDILP